MPPKNPLRLERLEDRWTPAAFGLPWVNAQAVTVSFAPDGTSVSGASSNLYAHLQANGISAAAFQGEALRAIQTWLSRPT